jgi:uncharacterized RmlC-like cupin family protein
METTKAGYDPIKVVRQADLTRAAGQTAGMTRYEGISGRTVGARRLWMGRAIAPAGLISEPHHHGESESAIYVTRGAATFLCGPDLYERVDVVAGDFLFVPPYAVHVEANLGGEEVEFVVVRSTQDAIVVNLPDHPFPRELLEPPMGV